MTGWQQNIQESQQIQLQEGNVQSVTSGRCRNKYPV